MHHEDNISVEEVAMNLIVAVNQKSIIREEQEHTLKTVRYIKWIILPSTSSMVLLASFSLCTTSSELCLIPNMFLWISHLKDITVTTARNVESCELAKAKGKRNWKMLSLSPGLAMVPVPSK
ncbi:hypothetical protein EDC94DRAFT_675218 [Helicostylum pulchrum]|nr:hypothetical protein EDC94DRAFT_675218 [Helicostylum pulchrum]